jgi:hypothetical protein
MPAYRVNEALACHWISEEIPIEKATSRASASVNIIEKIKQIKARPKPKFDF